jgi:beta-galactosidase
MFKEYTYDSLKRMIRRDRNHASICLWGVRINESADDHDFYSKTNEIARTLDPYRQTCGIRNFDGSEFLEDVYTYNDFSHTGNNPGVKKKLEIAKKDVPYMISEHNGHMFPTKAYDSESKRLDHAKRHLQVINDMMNPKSRISGSIGWVMNDYHTHPEFGSGDGICYHGVRDIYRMPKMASYSYLSQKETPFVLELSSNMNLGEYPGGFIEEVYVFTNLDSIKLYKNDHLVDTFYPDHKAYPHLAHPPVIIRDFVGKMMEEQEHISAKDAERFKKIIRFVATQGTSLSLRYKLMMAWLLKKYKLSLDDGMKLFYKYTTGWGDKLVSYRFEGYKEDVKVKEITKTYDESFICKLRSNKTEMVIEDTYDTLRFEFTCEDSKNNVKQYLFDPIQIETKGSIKLIGPHIQTLNSGQIALWVRSIKKGKGSIKITLRDQVIEKEVIVK